MPGMVLRFFQHVRAVARGVAAPVSLGVRAIVTDEKARVLLVRHTYLPGWHLPGGGVDRGESAADALLRELREEIGLDGAPMPELFGLYRRQAGRWTDHIVVYVIRAAAVRFRPNLEVAEIRFAGADALPEATSDATRRRLAEFAGGAALASVW